MSATTTETFSAMTTTGKIATGVIVLALGASAWALWKVGGALLAPSLQSAISVEPGDDVQKIYVDKVESDRDFLTSRSPFIPPAPPVAPEPETERNDNPPPVEKKPDIYGGPKLVGVAGDVAYFATAVLKGEPTIKMGEKGGSVEFVRIVPPSTAVLKWRGEEWPINLLEGVDLTKGSGPGVSGFPGTSTDPSRNFFMQQGSSPNQDVFQFEPDEDDDGSGLFGSSPANGSGSPAGNN